MAEDGPQRTDSALAAVGRVVRSIIRGEGLPGYVPDLIHRVIRVVALTFQRSTLGRFVTPGYHSARRRLRAGPDADTPRSLVFSHGCWQVAADSATATSEPVRLSRHLVLPPQPQAPDAGGDPPFEVDAVVTWVDGSDPAVGRRLLPDGPRPRRRRPWAAGRERLACIATRGELRAALGGLALYAPWIRRVFLVTAGQVPGWLDREHVVLVDHRQILSAEDLPTFNSHAIEAGLHRIEGLAEHWIYFNDDVLLGRAVSRSDFFAREGRAQALSRPVGADPGDVHRARGSGGSHDLLGDRGTSPPAGRSYQQAAPTLPIHNSVLSRKSWRC